MLKDLIKLANHLNMPNILKSNIIHLNQTLDLFLFQLEYRH